MRKNHLITLSLIAASDAFAPTGSTSTRSLKKAAIFREMCPGGWGIGTPNDMQDEEFSKGGTARRRRRKANSESSTGGTFDEVAYSAESAERAANKYALEDAMEFSQRVREEKDNLQMHKKKDLLEIAKIAGLGDRLKPKVNQDQGGDYGKFADDDAFGDDDDDDPLDVRVL